MEENLRRPMHGHYSGNQLYNTPIGIGIKYTLHWCCRVLHRQFAIVTWRESHAKQPLQPIATYWCKKFSKTLDCTKSTCWWLIKATNMFCFQDYWHMIFAVSDQKTKRIVELLIKKIRPFCGVLEVVLTDRGNKRFMSSNIRCLINSNLNWLLLSWTW